MAQKELSASRLLERTMNTSKRFVVHVGGARSGKTVAVSQFVVLSCLQRPIVASYIRKTLPALKATAFRDFKWVLEQLGAWSDDRFNATEMTYSFENGSLVEFISVDNPQKIRGRKRHIAFLNEANELSFEDFNQINLRTEEKVICDYNPSDSQSWLYDLEDGRASECDVIHSTYLDNPFLSDSIKAEIAKLQETDPDSYAVFGLGRRGSAGGLVYPLWHSVDQFPNDCEWTACGIDFGYNSPSGVVRVGARGDDLFVEQLMLSSGLTSSEIAQRCATLVRGREILWADSAEPDKIEDLKRAGVRVMPARKNVEAGITTVKSYSIHVVAPSPDLVREFGSYRWRTDRDGRRIDEPVKSNDHLMDAMRYAVYNTSRRGGGKLERGDVMWI